MTVEPVEASLHTTSLTAFNKTLVATELGVYSSVAKHETHGQLEYSPQISDVRTAEKLVSTSAGICAAKASSHR